MLTCPKCGNVERFLQRVIEMRAYSFYAPPDFQCESAWSDEWESNVVWDGSDFEETLEVLGIFCKDCGQLVISNGS